MDERFRKIGGYPTVEIAPPILQRRRLSAPETIMRKHTLAQQRSSSQDSAHSNNSENWSSNVGSDPNLTRRKETNVRKSTLIKRFWESTQTNQFPRTYSEWQYSFGKMKLSSNQSTPEHTRNSRRNIFEQSPKNRKLSPKKKVSVYNGNYSDVQTKLTTIETKSQITEGSEDSYIVYSSNFSNITESTGNTSRTTEDQNTTINFDSAYSHSCTTTSNKTTSSKESLKTYQINSNDIKVIENANIPDLPIKYQFVIKENINKDESKTIEFVPNDNETTTNNLNVISNVHLSQSTLNLIFNQVMQDVFQTKPNSLIKEEIKKPITEVNVGSPYKNTKSPLVPRLSALPRSTSMEVNISSNDSFEKESDSGSLIDSLDDPSSPKAVNDKCMNNELALLPDNSNLNKKSSVFYIPIVNKEIEPETIIEENKGSDVSALLPTKLKDRLMKRQLKREEKQKENRLRSFERIEERNHPYFDTSPETPKAKPQKTKTNLPAIETKKTRRKNSSDSSNSNKSFWLPKTRLKNEKLSPTSEADTKRVNKKTEKQIEILEIMEIVEPRRVINVTKTKSRIPVLVHHKLPKLQKPPEKPAFLNFDMQQSDSKLDQLIANLLIDTLNSEQLYGDDKIKFDSVPEEENLQNNNPNLIEKAAELLTKQVLENNNLSPETKSDTKDSNMPKGWITFYMLQKNNSPESTSDEGPKVKTTKIPKINHGKRTQKFDYKSNSDSDFESDKQHKKRYDKQKRGWSVTVSGTSNGEPAPDVEMRLKFPQLAHEQHASGFRRQQSQTEYSNCFPPLSNKRQEQSGFSFQEMCTNKRETEINKSKQYLKNYESTNQRSSVVPAKFEPRPTKTSTQRSMLNRSTSRRLRKIMVPLEPNQRKLEEILGKFPNILAVNGNAVSRESKPGMLNMSEQDLKQFLSQFDVQ